MPVTISQVGFRARTDTVEHTDNSAWVAALSRRWSQPLDTNFRVRFLLQRPPEGITLNGAYWTVYYSKNGGAYTFADNVAGVYTPNSVIRTVLSNVAGYVEGADCTQILGTKTFVSNNNAVTENQASFPTFSWAANASAETEVEAEFVFQVRSEYVQPGDSITLKVYISDAEITGLYSAVPVISVGRDGKFEIQSNGIVTINGGGTLTLNA